MTATEISLQQITTFVFDLDGVITDGQVLALSDGQILRNLNTKDAFGMLHAVRQGYRLAIITGGSGKGVKERLEGLGIRDIFTAARDKTLVMEAYIQDLRLDPNEILYLGDDMPDIPVFQMVGVSVTPSDGSDDARAAAAWTTTHPGGRGAVREVIEKVMKLQNKWYSSDVHHW
jgi:3-deoxy-D-manno-octulosonate 8-phosphate phosphatase (KDO 8-P phosphatase)